MGFFVGEAANLARAGFGDIALVERPITFDSTNLEGEYCLGLHEINEFGLMFDTLSVLNVRTSPLK